MGHVETSDEINECKRVGQQIYFRGIPVTCDKDSILTTEKRIAYGMTLTRVRKFISGLLKQYSPPGSVFYKNIEGDTNYKGELRYLNGDMIINIHLRAFPPGDDSYAFGVATVRDKLYKRTLGGELFINTRRIPNKYENYNTGNNSFF
ncbi:hypothetical protein TVAG_412270 [Trichomonas vaginalis G3]|uniref:Uncharacterized protein n=1 Tax=Trichomonas vaginalis (strain ATCC PRA-98 / G3) TaxID=412133 RepID=A2F1N3_TRIV3|nr:regulation of choline O-acetyltransferase protein [Trichomonas vaginalis G3]EAY01198.1 hypothetical protein TVAG_412270 [Trichomonas vaginalis G3]KAI5513188.1 regulation of choline O-acetyltransferase protein [Trichomonas vaginalis G3]|eukprot:XP_001314034.1 hypothetical protein [Trichomonas vaginalis G3]